MATIIVFVIMILKWENEIYEVQKYDKGGGRQR